MLQLSVSSLVPDPRLSAEEAAPGQAACHCPPGRRFDWILISDSDQTARPMGRRRRANQAWAAQASLAAVWYRLIVTSRPRHSSQPGDAARVCGARAGCEAPPSGLRRVGTRVMRLRPGLSWGAGHWGLPGVWSWLSHWAEVSREQPGQAWYQPRSRDIRHTVHCSGRGYEPWAPAPPPPSRLWADLGEWAAQWCHERWDDLNKNI